MSSIAFWSMLQEAIIITINTKLYLPCFFRYLYRCFPTLCKTNTKLCINNQVVVIVIIIIIIIGH